MYTANIYITLKESILDPKGKASKQALTNLGLSKVQDVRIGKFIQLKIEAESTDKAHNIAEQACQQLLANEVMENYSIDIKSAETVT